MLAGFVLARAAAGLSDNTIRSDVVHLEQLRGWFGGPLWDMEPADADAYFGKVLRDAAKGTRLARSQALKTYFLFLRHKVAIHQMTGRVAECPVDEMNRPRGAGRAVLRILPSAVQVGVLFAGWRAELATCRKFAPAARSYAAARLMADVGLRVNEASHLELGFTPADRFALARKGGLATGRPSFLLIMEKAAFGPIRPITPGPQEARAGTRAKCSSHSNRASAHLPLIRITARGGESNEQGPGERRGRPQASRPAGARGGSQRHGNCRHHERHPGRGGRAAGHGEGRPVPG